MDISDTHRKALELIDADDFASARDMLEAGLRGGDNSWIVKNDLAMCRFMLGDTDSAVELLNQVLARYPENSFARINRFYVIEADKVRKAPRPDPGSKIKEIRGQGPDKPFISVIMPTYNRPNLIRESLESVLRQTFQDFELLIVNDGGDRSVEKTMEKYLRDERIRYVYAESGGTASAVNVGLFLARGELVGYLDDDDIFYPDHISTMVEFFDSHPEAHAAHTLFYSALQVKEGQGFKVIDRKLQYGAKIDSESWRVQIQVPNRDPLMHRRELLERIGGFSEKLEYTEDWEFYLRLIKETPLHGIPKVTGEYRVRKSGEQKTARPKTERNHCRNIIIFKNGILPLTGTRFVSRGQGNTTRLLRSLELLLKRDERHMHALELRKLIREPYYSLFYRLGKDLLQEGRRVEARAAFRLGLRVSPFEPRLYLRALF